MKTAVRRITRSQLLIPLLALLLLVIFNLIRDPSFFAIKLVKDSYQNPVLQGNLVSVFNRASELAVLAMGMTLVTSVSRGQDISVGAGATIAGSVFISVLLSGPITWGLIIAAFLGSCVVGVMVGLFNGTLVSAFKIQPMIATLIMFTTGRAIAYWILGGTSPVVSDARLGYIGTTIPGVPIPTPIFVVIVCAVIFALLLKFTNLGLYMQAVGSNEKAARLNGINVVRTKILAFVIMGLCVAVAGTISVGRMGTVNYDTFLWGIEMDAILAVAIGGNSLGGGKFSMVGSIIGAYVIQGLTTTLLAMSVPSTALPAYKAVVIVLLVIIGSPVVKRGVSQMWAKLRSKDAAPSIKEGV
ncbi:MAG: ABC transporter permease [Firmicutes bacterium]|nr:ABC transporter permease [Bacillota bacterium]